MDKDRFELIKVGDSEEILHTVTVQDVDAFAGLTGDNNPLHMDDDFASKTSLKKRVVHGMLTASFISTVIGTKLPGKGALWYEQKLQFLSPVRIGETIRICCKVKRKSVSTRVLTIETVIFSENNRKAIQGEAKVKALMVKEEEKKNMNTKKGAIIITGASRGIGAATALSLAKDGFPVIVNFLNNQTLSEQVVGKIISKGGKASTFKADVTSKEEVEAMVKLALKKFGSIVGIVNNASPKVLDNDFSQLSWPDIQKQIDIQIKGAFNTCQAVLPHFLTQSYGTIVNIGSIYADNVPPTRILPYVIAKSALMSFTRCLALELGPKNIRVNCIAPGMTETDLIADVPEKIRIVTKMQTPLRSLAKPEDIAGVVSFLFSEKARHITGETIRVCGGIVMS